MNDDFKVWFSIQQNLNATIADGLEKHPYLYTTTESMNFVPFKLDKVGEKFELGDLWWGEEYNGIAYLIVSSEVTDSFGTFNFGKKEPIGKWIMWVAIGVSLFVDASIDVVTDVVSTTTGIVGWSTTTGGTVIGTSG